MRETSSRRLPQFASASPARRSCCARGAGRFSPLVCLASLCLALTLTSGCAATRLRADYTGYEAVYADTSNHEILLNLARLDKHDPTYFFKLGQIATQYQMGAGINGNGMYSPTSNPNGVGGGGTPTLSYQKNPSFQFIPVNDDATAQQLLKPIPTEIFYNLYQQGWRVDQLFRLMVDHIEFRQPGSTYWQVIRNSPTVDNANDYARFLRVTAAAYELQQLGYLRLGGIKSAPHVVTVADANSPPTAKDILAAEAQKLHWQKDATTGQWQLIDKGDLNAEFTLNVPVTVAELGDAYLADAAAATAHPDDAGAAIVAADAQKAYAAAVALAKNPKDPTLQATASTTAHQTLIDQLDEHMSELGKGGGSNGSNDSVQEVFLAILKDGFSVEESFNSSDANADPTKYSCQLVMRSLIGVMAAAAQEQDEFTALKAANPNVPAPNPSNQLATLPFSSVVPQVEMQPIISLKWAAGDFVSPPLAQVSYENDVYAVSDACTLAVAGRCEPAPHDGAPRGAQTTPASAGASPSAGAPAIPGQDASWNRDVFRLIAELSAQVTIDISKFPLPSILQLNTQ
jgi:hypothetical protein